MKRSRRFGELSGADQITKSDAVRSNRPRPSFSSSKANQIEDEDENEERK